MNSLSSDKSGHILVVDDNRMNRLKLAHVLQQQGHSVAEAENGQQALAMLHTAVFDVVLLDIIMPEMDGHEVLARMKADTHLRQIPVIVISAVDEVESAVRCIEAGAEDYLPKPFNPVFLRARLNASLQRKKLRDLEQVYLQQEIMLRQSEKLATLGKLSAGMAHELNNPAAATQRGAEQLRQLFGQLQTTYLQLGQIALSEGQLNRLTHLTQQPAQPASLHGLARSDSEYEVEGWLEEHEIGNGWELAPALVEMGYTPDRLDVLAVEFEGHGLATAVAWLTNTHTIYTLLQEISEGAARISQIVKALKTYTYLDQSPVQDVDVHKGLDNTLIMLRSKLKQGITIQRDYCAHLPRITAYGSELNQVWTNIIDNAIAAMNGQGQISIRSHYEGNWITIEIEDDGPGIPEEIQNKIFDPFFTTKAPGEGTGLGLNISHNIIVQKHKGQIALHSQPGHTTFQIKLPVQQEGD